MRRHGDKRGNGPLTELGQRPRFLPRRRRVVVVTGAGGGAGRAAAVAFGARGDRVALPARGREGLAAAADEVRRAGGEPLVVPVDVADAEAVDAAAQQVADAFGHIARRSLTTRTASGPWASFHGWWSEIHSAWNPPARWSAEPRPDGRLGALTRGTRKTPYGVHDNVRTNVRVLTEDRSLCTRDIAGGET